MPPRWLLLLALLVSTAPAAGAGVVVALYPADCLAGCGGPGAEVDEQATVGWYSCHPDGCRLREGGALVQAPLPASLPVPALGERGCLGHFLGVCFWA